MVRKYTEDWKKKNEGYGAVRKGNGKDVHMMDG